MYSLSLLVYSDIDSEVAQPCPTLGDPVDCSLPGFSVHGILQARILEWELILMYSLSIINIPYQSGTFVTIDEPTLANYCDLKSIVYITLYYWCTFYGLGQMYNGM